MKIPENVNARWIDTLDDAQLLTAESSLHADFMKHETAEKRRRGARYNMFQGPNILVTTWLRWLMVSNATRSRGLLAARSH